MCALSALGTSSGSSGWALAASGFFPVFFPFSPVSFVFHLKISISSTFARKLWESQWSLLTMSVILLVSGLHRLGMYLLSFARAKMLCMFQIVCKFNLGVIILDCRI